MKCCNGSKELSNCVNFLYKKGKITYLQKNTLKLSNCNYTFFNKKLFHKKGHENKSRLTVYAKKWILKTKLFYQWLWRQFAQLETSVKNCLLKIIIYLWNNQETLFKKNVKSNIKFPGKHGNFSSGNSSNHLLMINFI